VKILSKYILREHLMPFIGGLAIIMFVLVMDFILDILNLIIAKGVEPLIVLKLFSLNLAWMLALAVPMTCLIAGLMAFGRLAEDREIIAAVSSGIPLVRLMFLPLGVALILSVFMIFFSNSVLPEANYEAKMLMGDIKRKKPALAIKERVFIDDFPGVGLYIEEVEEKTNELRGITIYDQQDRRIPRIVQAEYGKMSYSENSDVLILELYDGVIHEIDEQDPSKHTRVNFDRQTIRFSDLGFKLQRRDSGHRGDRELTIEDMKERIAAKDSAIARSMDNIVEFSDKAFRAAFIPSGKNTPSDPSMIYRSIRKRVESTLHAIKSQMNTVKAHRRYIRKYSVEIHKKITLPFACVFFLLVGAPVGVWARKGGLGVGIGLGLGFIVIYWAFLIGGEELADRGFIAPWLAMWLPNFVMVAIGGGTLYRTIWSSHFKTVGAVARMWRKVARIFRREKLD